MRELQPIHLQAVDYHPASNSYVTLTHKGGPFRPELTYPDQTMTRAEYHEWLARNSSE